MDELTKSKELSLKKKLGNQRFIRNVNLGFLTLYGGIATPIFSVNTYLAICNYLENPSISQGSAVALNGFAAILFSFASYIARTVTIESKEEIKQLTGEIEIGEGQLSLYQNSKQDGELSLEDRTNYLSLTDKP